METYWTGVEGLLEAKASNGADIFFRPYSSILHQKDALHGSSEIHFKFLASRRMAAVALAMRLYELDDGRRPNKLEDLVEKYIPFIPDDPFDESGGKIRYLPGGEVPLLYCIGSDGKDDGGAFIIYEGDWRKGYVDTDSEDHVFFLNGNRPFGKPAIPGYRNTADDLARKQLTKFVGRDETYYFTAARRFARLIASLDCGFHWGGVGAVFPGDIEGSPVAWAGADNRQAHSQIHRVFPGQQFYRDKRLVVIHRNNAIELAPHSPAKKRIGWIRACNVDAVFGGHENRRGR